MRNCRSKSVNFSLFHYRDTPPRPLGWYFPPLWLTSRYPRHGQNHHSTCGRPCPGIKVGVLGIPRQYSWHSSVLRQRSPILLLFWLNYCSQASPVGITDTGRPVSGSGNTQTHWRVGKSDRNSGIPESARTPSVGSSCTFLYMYLGFVLYCGWLRE